MSFVATAIAGTALAGTLAAATGLSAGAVGAGLTAAGTAALKGGSKAITKGIKKSKERKEEQSSKLDRFNTKSQSTGYGGPSMMGHNPISKHMGGKGAAMCGVKK